MLRISTVDTQSERRLVVEGKLIPPWVGELRKSWSTGLTGLNGRKFVIDLTNATVISPEGEEALFALMKEGAKFSCGGILTKHMLKKLAARCHDRRHETDQERSTREPGRLEVHVVANDKY